MEICKQENPPKLFFDAVGSDLFGTIFNTLP
jgi:uncharacterized SAM-dependent methyltransferase